MPLVFLLSPKSQVDPLFLVLPKSGPPSGREPGKRASTPDRNPSSRRARLLDEDGEGTGSLCDQGPTSRLHPGESLMASLRPRTRAAQDVVRPVSSSYSSPTCTAGVSVITGVSTAHSGCVRVASSGSTGLAVNQQVGGV